MSRAERVTTFHTLHVLSHTAAASMTDTVVIDATAN